MFNNGVFSQAIIKCMSKQKNHQPLDRLLEIARAHEIQGPAALARRLGETEQTVTNWGSRGVSKQGAMKAQAEFGVSANWLLTGIGPKFVTGGEEPALIDLDNNPEYPAIRRVRFKLSAGASGYGVEYREDEGSPIVFQRDWYASKGFKPGKLFAVRVTNHSMEPKYHDGDTVVVNTESKAPKDGIAFAVNYEGELVIKRLIRDAGQWWLSSDNPDQRKYPRKVCDENCEIIGEIVLIQSSHT